MHLQRDLFSPMLARSFHLQGELFNQPAADADSDRRCHECQSFLVRTASGFLCCPRGHGKLIEEATSSANEPCMPRPWPVAAAETARLHAGNARWLYGRWRCICGACRYTRSH